jgi:FkbM family methyltransferase
MLKEAIKSVLAKSPLADLPITIRNGAAKGAKWTIFPFSMYWRLGGDTDVAMAAAFLPNIQGSVFWDFGAHFGIHSVAMALKVGPAGQVVSFEPDAYSFAKLSKHIRLNRLQNVKTINAAVSNHRGTGTMISFGAGASTQHFVYPDADGEDASKATLPVQTVVADDLVENKEIRAPDLIKVDVEGHGAFALSGAIKAISRHKPLIVMSSHSNEETRGTQEILEPLGYAVFSLSSQRLSWPDLTYTTKLLRAH